MTTDTAPRGVPLHVVLGGEGNDDRGNITAMVGAGAEEFAFQAVMNKDKPVSYWFGPEVSEAVDRIVMRLTRQLAKVRDVHALMPKGGYRVYMDYERRNLEDEIPYLAAVARVWMMLATRLPPDFRIVGLYAFGNRRFSGESIERFLAFAPGVETLSGSLYVKLQHHGRVVHRPFIDAEIARGLTLENTPYMSGCEGGHEDEVGGQGPILSDAMLEEILGDVRNAKCEQAAVWVSMRNPRSVAGTLSLFGARKRMGLVPGQPITTNPVPAPGVGGVA